MKRSVWLLLAAVVLSLGVGVTVAYFTAASQPVENTFTVGSVAIALSESTGTEYLLAPGVELMKDPVVTVKKNSDACWLLIEVEPSAELALCADYEIRSEWSPLTGVSGVYYQSVEHSGVDRIFHVLKNDRIYVREDLTEEELNALGAYPTLELKAYAIQRDGVATPEAAWQILKEA